MSTNKLTKKQQSTLDSYIESRKTDYLIELLSSLTKKKVSDIEEMVKEKIDELGGFINELASVHILFSELGHSDVLKPIINLPTTSDSTTTDKTYTMVGFYLKKYNCFVIKPKYYYLFTNVVFNELVMFRQLLSFCKAKLENPEAKEFMIIGNDLNRDTNSMKNGIFLSLSSTAKNLMFRVVLDTDLESTQLFLLPIKYFKSGNKDNIVPVGTFL